jgi:hypothetical protein
MQREEATPETKRAFLIGGVTLGSILLVVALIVWQFNNSFNPNNQISFEEYGETIHSYALNICIQETNLSSIAKFRTEEMISAFLISTNDDLSDASCKGLEQKDDSWLVKLETAREIELEIDLQPESYIDTMVTISAGGGVAFQKSTSNYAFTYRPVSQLSKALPAATDYDGTTYYVTGNAQTGEIYIAAPNLSEAERAKGTEAAKRLLQDNRFDANRFTYRVSDQASDWSNY